VVTQTGIAACWAIIVSVLAPAGGRHAGAASVTGIDNISRCRRYPSGTRSRDAYNSRRN
jgi:hypothetical protein